MSKYVMEFSKKGTMRYISHLDVMRVFKRGFKRAGIKLSYSQGFNPHPRMGFAQPLSLGYEGLKEYIEFETVENYQPEALLKKMRELMPDGLEINKCRYLEGLKKTLAAETVAARYSIIIPIRTNLNMNSRELLNSYMGQDSIMALKKKKKEKEAGQIDIKPMIRSMDFHVEKTRKQQSDELCEKLKITALLDSGSVSNLSPELVIASVIKYFGIDADRSEIDVVREEIILSDRVNI